MSPSEILRRLHLHQETIRDLSRTAEAILTGPEPRDTAGLARTRWAAMRALTEYQLFKQGEIYDPAIAGRHPGEAQRAARLKRACVTMAEDFRSHVARWSTTDVAGAWPTYQPAALRMITRVRAHLERERGEVAALLSPPDAD